MNGSTYHNWMASHACIVGAAILAVLVASCAGTSNPPSEATAPNQLSTATPASGDSAASQAALPPLTETFRSPTMGYAVHYPVGWTVYAASESWRAGDDELWDSPNGDRIESIDAGFRGGSQPLAAGQSAKAWLDAYMALEPTGCGVREEIPLGGSQGTVGLNGCPGQGRLGGRVFDVVVVVGGRAYNFTMEGNVDHALLLAVLKTIAFDPASAID